MLNKITTLACFALSFLFVSPTQGQGSQVPTQEGVENLLKIIDFCKRDVATLKKDLKLMEDNPSTINLEDYLFTKAMIEEDEDCIKKGRAALDKLRKDYTGWFNQPGVNMRLSNGHEISPGQLEKLVADWEKAIASFIKRMERIQKPE